MIFAEAFGGESAMNYDAISESPYELGISGALMHVYENERNYNALMKAAALSEMKYYTQTGGDLYVQEAGALAKFGEKIKEFFKKAIEKIKSIFKKFVAMINSYTMKDADFIKKYKNQIIKLNLKDFKYTGYKFTGLESNPNGFEYKTTFVIANLANNFMKADELDQCINLNRGEIIGEKEIERGDFNKELHSYLYGDKDEFAVDIKKQLDIITNTKESISKAEKAQKKAIDSINSAIKHLDKTIKESNKTSKEEMEDDGHIASELKTEKISFLQVAIEVYKAYTNDITLSYGAYVRAMNDRNRQAKAICVKAMSYKAPKESAITGDNLFAGVQII